MKWAFKQQEATRQGKGHRKKTTTTWRKEQEEHEEMKEEQLLPTDNECHQRATSSTLSFLSLSLSCSPLSLSFCLSLLHSSTYCCFVLVRPLCCYVYFETYSRCVMWFHFWPFVVVASIVVALISQPDKEETSQRPPELSLQGDSSNCWRVAQEVLQAQ